MKSNKKIIMKMFIVIISFILLVSTFINVEASEKSEVENISTIAVGSSDVSSEGSTLSKFLARIQIVKMIICVIGLVLTAIGVISIKKKQTKKGIIFITIAIILFCMIGVLGIVFHKPVVIK